MTRPFRISVFYILLLSLSHTCHLNFECQFFCSHLTRVFSGILFFYIADDQPTNLALRIHLNGSAGTQLFTIFIPFNLCGIINNLTAQSGFLRENSFHFPLDSLFVEESRFSLDFCSGGCKGA